MRPTLIAVLFMACTLASTPIAYGAQGLADLARQQRQTRGDTPGDGRKITTETATAPKPGAALTIAGAAQPAAPVATEGEVRPEAEGAPATPEVDTGQEPALATGDDQPLPETEEAWRTRFDEARAEVGRSAQQLALAEGELGELNAQLLIRSDIYNREYQLAPLIAEKQAEILAARTRLDEANQALEALRTDLRRAGLPAGWGR